MISSLSVIMFMMWNVAIVTSSNKKKKSDIQLATGDIR